MVFEQSCLVCPLLGIPASCKSYNLGPKRRQTILLLTRSPGTEQSLHSFRALLRAENSATDWCDSWSEDGQMTALMSSQALGP